MLNFPLPNSSIVLTHPAAAPGTVTELRSVKGIYMSATSIIPLCPCSRRGGNEFKRLYCQGYILGRRTD